jgi:hypothetical protein
VRPSIAFIISDSLLHINDMIPSLTFHIRVGTNFVCSLVVYTNVSAQWLLSSPNRRRLANYAVWLTRHKQEPPWPIRSRRWMHELRKRIGTIAIWRLTVFCFNDAMIIAKGLFFQSLVFFFERKKGDSCFSTTLVIEKLCATEDIGKREFLGGTSNVSAIRTGCIGTTEWPTENTTKLFITKY